MSPVEIQNIVGWLIGCSILAYVVRLGEYKLLLPKGTQQDAMQHPTSRK